MAFPCRLRDACRLTLEEVAAIRDGPDLPVWHGKPQDVAVMRATDELLDTATISDATWADSRGSSIQSS